MVDPCYAHTSLPNWFAIQVYVADGIAWCWDYVACILPTDYRNQPNTRRLVDHTEEEARQLLATARRYVDTIGDIRRAQFLDYHEGPVFSYFAGPRPDGLLPDTVIGLHNTFIAALIGPHDAVLAVHVEHIPYVLVVRATTVTAVIRAQLEPPVLEPIAALLIGI